MLLNKGKLITLWGAWNSDEISLKDKQMIINQLSGGTFNEKPVEEKKSASQLWQRSRYFVSDGSESSIKIVNIIGQKLSPEQCPKDNSKDFGTD